MANRLQTVLSGRVAAGVPFLPIVGAHAARVMGIPIREMYTDANRLALSLLSVLDLYGFEGISVGCDRSVEAEALGGEVVWADDTSPTFRRSAGPPVLGGERAATVREAARHVAKQVGSRTALMAVVVGPATLALSLSPGGPEAVLASPQVLLQAAEAPLKAVQESIKGYGATVLTVAVCEPLLPLVPDELFEPALRSAYVRLSSLCGHFQAQAVLYPGPLGGGPSPQRYGRCGFRALLVDSAERHLAAGVTPALGVCVQPQLFKQDTTAAAACARELRASLDGQPAFICTADELAFDSSVDALRAFLGELGGP